MLKAGVSLVDISPEKGISLYGYPQGWRFNEGVHDSIYAACLYLNNGKDELVMFACDLLYFGKKYTEELRRRIGKPVMISCSHTHCAPRANQYMKCENIPQEILDAHDAYMSILFDKMENAAKEAIANTFDAEIGFEVGKCGYEQGMGGNRRYKNGLSDPSVNVMAVREKGGNIKSVLVNYTLHPTYLHEDNLLVSADYPGYIRRYMQFAAPDAVFMFAQGTSGNQSPRYFRVAQNFEECARGGTTLGVEAFHCLEKMKFEDEVDIRIRSLEFEPELKTFCSLEEAEQKAKEADDHWAAVKASGASWLDAWNAELLSIGAHATIRHIKTLASGEKDPEFPAEVQVVSFNKHAIVAIPGEHFVEYGLAIKEAAKKAGYETAYVFHCSNGTLPGYCYTAEELAMGGYEVGNSMLGPNAGNQFVEAATKLLNE